MDTPVSPQGIANTQLVHYERTHIAPHFCLVKYT